MREVDQHVGATIAAKYRIRRLIGVGGMGAVYEGQHIDPGEVKLDGVEHVILTEDDVLAVYH